MWVLYTRKIRDTIFRLYSTIKLESLYDMIFNQTREYNKNCEDNNSKRESKCVLCIFQNMIKNNNLKY